MEEELLEGGKKEEDEEEDEEKNEVEVEEENNKENKGVNREEKEEEDEGERVINWKGEAPCVSLKSFSFRFLILRTWASWSCSLCCSSSSACLA